MRGPGRHQHPRPSLRSPASSPRGYCCSGCAVFPLESLGLRASQWSRERAMLRRRPREPTAAVDPGGTPGGAAPSLAVPHAGCSRGLGARETASAPQGQRTRLRRAWRGARAGWRGRREQVPPRGPAFSPARPSAGGMRPHHGGTWLQITGGHGSRCHPPRLRAP